MVGGLGIIIIFIMIIRHVGACVRENNHNQYLRNSAVQNNYYTYHNANGNEILLNNGHRCHTRITEEFGREVKDLITGEKAYPDVQKLYDQYCEDKRNKSYTETVWKGRLKNWDVYIDYSNDKMMRKVKLFPLDTNKLTCEFYTDFWTRTQVLRKTDNQIEIDKKLVAKGREDEVIPVNEIEQWFGKDHFSYDSYENKWKIATP